jgi:hypothetical protein
MMSPVLPIALAFAALALVHLRLAWHDTGIAAGLVAVVSGSIVLAGARLQSELAFTICWGNVLASAGTAILARQPPRALALTLATATGISTGLVAASTGGGLSLIEATPAVLVLALTAVRQWNGLRLLVQIVAAWMLAVALLSAAIPLVATPGYRSDHRE